MKYWILSVILFIFVQSLSARKEQEVTATYTYYAPENVTPEEAKRIALDRAKITAIADVFGTTITQNTVTTITNQNGQTDSHFFSLGGSDVKGEWIETTKEPVYKIWYEDGMQVVSVVVKGVIREIVSAAIDFKAKVLCNGTKDKFESNSFKSGDELYVSFQSPVNGFLAIYLEGEDGQVYCLLPYSGQKEGIYPIEANLNYVFFDRKSASSKEETSLVEECYMTCNNTSEYNQIYIIFSPNRFAKASDSDKVTQDNHILPRHLPSEEFHKWRSKCMKHDVEMHVMPVGITVVK